MSRKHDYGNRKFRKTRKMDKRESLSFWDMTGDPYKGKEREIIMTICKSASLETIRHAERKIKEWEEWLKQH